MQAYRPAQLLVAPHSRVPEHCCQLLPSFASTSSAHTSEALSSTHLADDAAACGGGPHGHIAAVLLGPSGNEGGLIGAGRLLRLSNEASMIWPPIAKVRAVRVDATPTRPGSSQAARREAVCYSATAVHTSADLRQLPGGRNATMTDRSCIRSDWGHMVPDESPF